MKQDIGSRSLTIVTSALLSVLFLGVAYAQFEDDPFAVRVGGKTGYINRDGTIVIATKFTGGEEFSEGRAAVVVDGKWMFIDQTGTLISDRQFDSVGSFSEGRCRVAIGKFGKRLWGFIDSTGELVIDFQYKEARDFSEGLAKAVNPDNSWGFIDKEGTIIIQEGIADFSEGLTIFASGYVDRAGNQVIDLDISAPEVNSHVRSSFKEGLAYYRLRGGGWGFIERATGRLAFKVDVDDVNTISSFSDGLAKFTLNERSGEDFQYGYIDRTGKVAISPQTYAFANDFSEGKAAVAIREPEFNRKKYGFIDKTGQVVIPFAFTFASNFSRGLALVATEDGRGYIDHNGNMIWKPAK